MEVIRGIPVSPGVVIGRAFVLDDDRERVPRQTVSKDAVAGELRRLESAVREATEDIQADRDNAANTLGPGPAKIFDVHLGLLRDASLINLARSRIENEYETAEYAVSVTFGELAERFRGMEGEVFQQKASDIIDLDRRILGKLVGQTEDRLAAIEDAVVVIAPQLTPAQAANLDTSKVKGFATDGGGRTSHEAIVAAALGLPVVVGCKDVSLRIFEGDLVIIDGTSGNVVTRPDAETLALYGKEIGRLDSIREELDKLAKLEPVTADGTKITLLGNIEFPHEIDLVLKHGGAGVGLYRTEFLYITSLSEPTEEQLYGAYKHALEMLDGRSMTIRTFDLGADKHTQKRSIQPERNPFLGLRSIRYCLQNLPMFKTQLRAILRASAHGPMKIMFPLISTAMELRQAKMVLQDVMEECAEEGIAFDPNIPVGMMIEVPGAALMASVFAREVSFFSIGTNDLIQYTLAVDRGNERVANLYSGANPAVVQLIKSVIRSAKRMNVDTSICGEIAGEVTYTMLLIGLGLRTLSLVPSQIPKVKQVIRSVDIESCERLARKVGSLDSERKVLATLREALRTVLPEDEGGWSVS